METEEQSGAELAEQDGPPDRVTGRPAGDAEIPGLVRRARRVAKLSQRELAHVLGVSQSAVAKWETGRTNPTARMLKRLLGVAELSLVAVRTNGDQVKPMKAVAARDAAGRRYPAHAYVWAEGWWAPEGAEMTAWFNQIRWRSEVLELPRVRYSRRWQLGRSPTVADVLDHPTWEELLAEAREGWGSPRCHLLPIPEWAFQDSRKSRNRRPDDFRALARAVSLARNRNRNRNRNRTGLT